MRAPAFKTRPFSRLKRLGGEVVHAMAAFLRHTRWIDGAARFCQLPREIIGVFATAAVRLIRDVLIFPIIERFIRVYRGTYVKRIYARLWLRRFLYTRSWNLHISA